MKPEDLSDGMSLLVWLDDELVPASVVKCLEGWALHSPVPADSDVDDWTVPDSLQLTEEDIVGITFDKEGRTHQSNIAFKTEGNRVIRI
jgi:hypothetical protein